MKRFQHLLIFIFLACLFWFLGLPTLLNLFNYSMYLLEKGFSFKLLFNLFLLLWSAIAILIGIKFMIASFITFFIPNKNND
ncbi:hypothetical protein [Acetoanaerobium noterae]|uniref:hypothetical protein n=1 Tax=Acetoanaerobium noterae TaxID=745369 RepID=UPI0028B0F44F|nr:hypothetical protein [Acetoanaerobium noterae]